MATEIKLPRVFGEHTFCTPAEQVPSITIDLPGKMFAVPSYGITTSKTRAEQLYSHVENGIDNGHSADRKWSTLRWFPGRSVSDVANSMPQSAGFGWLSQIAEDRGNAGMAFDWNFVDAVREQYFGNTGQSDPANTNIIGDYFDHDGLSQPGLSSLLQPVGSSYWNNWRTRFSSESEARKNRDGNLSSFFARGVYESSNWMATGYLDGWHRVPEHIWPYHQFAEAEQKHLAIRRKVVQFAWDVFEGAEWKIYRMGSFQGIRFETPAGYIYKSTLNQQPPEMMYRQGLISHIVGDGMVHWGPAGRDTSDIARWVRSYNGGAEAAKTQWKGDNMAFPVTYDYNNPQHPAKSPGDNPTNQTNPDNISIVPPAFGGPAPKGVHNSLGGRYMSELIKNKYSNLAWPSFTYKINGGTTRDGYFNGEDPVLGSLGNATISTLNNRNFGQHNIVNQLEHKLPICLHGTDVAIWCNPLARVNEVNEVTLGDGTTFEAIGPQMRVFDK